MEVQIIPGYRGLIKLARNTREISTVLAQEVFPADTFSYQFGTDPKIAHVPGKWGSLSERGEAIGYYAVMRLKDGGTMFDVMSRQEVEAHRDRYSRAAKQGPWVTEFDEMAKKTVLRKVCKLGPQSIELQTAVALDERAEVQLPQELPDVVDPVDEPYSAEASSKLDQLADQVAGTTA